jgi:hypothetical protein
MRQNASACVSMRQHASAWVSMRQHASLQEHLQVVGLSSFEGTSTRGSMRQHTSAIRLFKSTFKLWSWARSKGLQMVAATFLKNKNKITLVTPWAACVRRLEIHTESHHAHSRTLFTIVKLRLGVNIVLHFVSVCVCACVGGCGCVRVRVRVRVSGVMCYGEMKISKGTWKLRKCMRP